MIEKVIITSNSVQRLWFYLTRLVDSDCKLILFFLCDLPLLVYTLSPAVICKDLQNDRLIDIFSLHNRVSARDTLYDSGNVTMSLCLQDPLFYQRQPLEWPVTGSKCQTGDNTQWDYTINQHMVYNILSTQLKCSGPGIKASTQEWLSSSSCQCPKSRICVSYSCKINLSHIRCLASLTHGKLDLMIKFSSLFTSG